MNNEDIISKLPDAVLSKILSFLDLKPAIHTSILSNRWKPLWTFLEDFDFNFDHYRNQTDPFHYLYHRLHEEAVLRPYVRFVNGVLSNRDDTSKIGKFRLKFNVNVDPIFIQNCIHYAITHNVDDLDISTFHHPKPLHFPPNFLESRSLRKLRLKFYHGQNMIIPKPFCFPNLKTLYLEHFPFKDDDDFCFPIEPFSRFTNLEELTLDCCVIDGLMILAPELKVLKLQFRGYQPEFSSECKILKAVTPKLKSFEFVGQVSLICPMDELPFLDKVYLDLYPILESPYTDEVKKKMPINLFKLLEHFKNAKSLTLSSRTIQVLSMDSVLLQQYPSPFINLKHLKLISRTWENLNVLLSENIMAYFKQPSSFTDSIILENLVL